MHAAQTELKDLLDQKAAAYNTPCFIEEDPISIPHRFTAKEDREISAFLTALLSWGQRPVILRNAWNLMERMDLAPSQFIRQHAPQERKRFGDFIHRTFNGTDAVYLLKALQQVYLHHGGLENIFARGYTQDDTLPEAIHLARGTLLSFKAPSRTGKHLADPLRNAAAKRICMFLRWMVRKDNAGVDFGIWSSIPPSALFCPLDLHSGRVARSLGLLHRRQDDWKAVHELTMRLRTMDPEDPVRYDFALYGLGVFEKFS